MSPVKDANPSSRISRETILQMPCLRASARLFVACIVAVAAVATVSAPAASAAGGPAWALDVSHYPTQVTPGRNAYVAVIPTNVGTTASSGGMTIKVALPADITPTGITGSGMFCTLATLTCTDFFPVAAGTQSSTAAGIDPATGVIVAGTVDANPSASVLTATATISGGGAPVCGGVGGEAACVTASEEIPVGTPSTAFSVTDFSTAAIDSSGQDVTQAGGHPWLATTAFGLNTNYESPSSEIPGPVADARSASVGLPPGFVGNALATPRCPIYLQTLNKNQSECPVDTQVGRVTLIDAGPSILSAPVFNVVPEAGYPAEFGFTVADAPQFLPARLRSDGSYALDLDSKGISVLLGTNRVLFTFWGQPGLLNGGGSETPFVSDPTNCSAAPPVTSLAVDSWIDPGAEGNLGNPILSDPNWKTTSFASPALTGCDKLKFEPTISVAPESTQADTPSAFSVHLHIPQSEDFNTPATPPLRDAVVTLPQGVAVNPALAEGLQGCTDAQFAEHSGEAGNCPDAAKIGSLEVTTPLLDHKLPGSIYVRQPDPGASRASGLYTVFLEVDDPSTGVIVKLRGSVIPDERTGQLTATFDDNPQLPFSDLDLSFKGGPRSALITPSACGTYATRTQLTPWAGEGTSPAATPSSSFTIDSCPGGGFDPKLSAGSAGNGAGQPSAFNLRMTRADGEQNIASIDATLPEGLLAKLAGVPLCSDAAANTGGCPASTKVGSTTVGAGAGSNPLYVPQPGKAPTAVYLAGPYKGAPYSLVIDVPAQAGPFDLGNVVVRSAIDVNPDTAQVTVKSDPLPQVLEGVPIAYRDIRVDIDRPDFTLNPTDCEPMSVDSTIFSAQGRTASPSARFQVGECEKLGFRPSLSLALKGQTKRSGNPALTAILTAPSGQANIAQTAVILPKSEFIDNRHINNPCTRVQFDSGAGDGAGCPAASILGRATAYTPLLERPLTGNVYFRSNGGERKLPDLVASLDGQIHVNLVGFIDSVHKKGSQTSRTRTTFASVPDAPVSRFVLELQGGKKGLLQNSTNLCRSTNKATVKMSGQNGKTHDFETAIKAGCGKKTGKKKSKARAGH
jgi:hypothetical protein